MRIILQGTYRLPMESHANLRKEDLKVLTAEIRLGCIPDLLEQITAGQAGLCVDSSE